MKANNFLSKIRRIWCETPFVQCFVISLLLSFTIEIICRRSFVDAVVFTFTRPLFFLAGFSLILLTMSVSLFFRKRVFFYVLIGTVWLALGITNCVLVLVRTAPFEAVDFSILRTGLGIITIYMEIWQIILVAAALLSVIGLIVWLGIRLKKQKVDFKKAGIGFATSALISASLLLPMNLGGLYPKAFSNLAHSYDTYGFIYCFTCSIFDRGIDRPKDYSHGKIEEVTSSLDESNPVTVPENMPNIIYLQLESFIDVNRLQNVTFSENPVPFFEELKNQYTSGLLTVPSIGAGTANTEFEIITGMSHHDFGTGEYPYKSFLKKKACESVPFLLKETGMSSHAIHNYTATFYERNIAYSSLGFDTFTSIEYMNLSENDYNQLGWAKDAILTEQILNAMKSTDGSDLILTVSVQGHGKYAAADNPKIRVNAPGMDEGMLDGLTYYVNQIAEMDVFLRELTEALSASGEDVILVMYGDHLPSLGFREEDLSSGSLYQTEYVIWSSYELEKKDRDLTAYQLAAYSLSQCGYSDGYLLRLHQSHFEEENSNYDNDLQLLEYDMLNGKRYIYNGEVRYHPTAMKMGVLPIQVTEVTENGESLLIKGTNFTESSVVSINGHEKKTIFVSDTELRVDGGMKPGDRISVIQITKDRVKLSRTEEYIAP